MQKINGYRVGVGLFAGVLTVSAGAQGIPPALRRIPDAPPAKPSAAIPATAPTQVQAPVLQSVTGAPALPPAPVRRARVDYQDQMLRVAADNSSLNQILREIGRLTGLKITGGVNDERVFGNYGPAPLPDILQTLLSGTGSNMLLVESAEQAPMELILTPRQGGPSPPNPMAERDAPDQFEDLPPQLRPRTSNIPPANPPQPENPPQPRPFVPPSPNPSTADAAPVTQPPTTTDQSPNGVKTPQQIFDQLMQMQQQNAKKPQ